MATFTVSVEEIGQAPRERARRAPGAMGMGTADAYANADCADYGSMRQRKRATRANQQTKNEKNNK
eukprot:gene2861-4237_t